MKLHTLVLAFGLGAAATVAQAQTASAPVDPLVSLQNAFGQIVGFSFHVPDQIAAATIPQADATLTKPLGGVLRTSLEVPGAAFAALFVPFDTDLKAPPAPAAAAASAPAPAPRHRRAKVTRHRAHVKPTIG